MTWPAVRLERPPRTLLVAPLADAPGMAVATRPDDPRWSVLRLAARPFADDASFARAVQRAADDLFRLDPLGAPPAPARPRAVRSLFVHLTSACNLRCAHCYVLAEAPAAGPAVLPRARLEAVLDALAPRGLAAVTLSGGEPLLYPGLDPLVQGCRDRGLAVQLLTNATTVTDDAARRLAAAGVDVSASLHGPDAATHDALVGPGSFDAATRGIRLLAARLGPARLLVNCTLHDDNVALAEATIQAAAGLGAGRIRFIPLHRPLPDGPRLDYASAAMLDWAGRAAAGIVGGRFPLRVDPGMTGRPGARAVGDHDESGCAIGCKLVLAAGGDLYPCALLMAPGDRLGVAGDVLAVAGGAPLQALGDAVQARAARVEGCRGCLLAGICRGGCPALPPGAGGRDPLCAANQAFARTFFTLAARARSGATGPSRSA
ncbi:MAG TPA: radical SAM protein [Polyangia bacterium]